jgi:hypothetical protein
VLPAFLSFHDGYAVADTKNERSKIKGKLLLQGTGRLLFLI